MVELMMAVAIIGILVAIAVPQFTGVTDRADKNAVRGDLNRALSEVKADATSQQSYVSITDTTIKAEGVTVKEATINKLVLAKDLPEGGGECTLTVTAGGKPVIGGAC